jgi:hypothetical protein
MFELTITGADYLKTRIKKTAPETSEAVIQH